MSTSRIRTGPPASADCTRRPGAIWPWRDIGLSDWLFDFDVPAEAAAMPAAVLALARDPAPAKRRAEAARARVRDRFRATMAVVSREATPISR